MGQDTLEEICAFLEASEADAFSAAAPSVKSVLRMVSHSKHVRCFFNKSVYTDSIIGYGVKPVYYEGGDEKKLVRPRIQTISTSFDWISHDAYTAGLRKSVWNIPFTHFLPLYIHRTHYKRSRHVLEQSLCAIMYGSALERKEERDVVKAALEVVPHLMSSTVVGFCDGTEKTRPTLYYSEKAMSGFCACHHLLLGLAKQYPAMRTEVDALIHDFIRSPTARHKNVVPNLGVLIVLSTLSSYRWSDLVPALLEEIYIRNVRWVAKSFPVILQSTCDDETLLSCFYRGSVTSKRLFMFQSWFMRFARRKPNAELLHDYDGYRGAPPTFNLASLLQSTCSRIQTMDSWESFYAFIKVTHPGTVALAASLRNAIHESARAGYHTVSSSSRTCKT